MFSVPKEHQLYIPGVARDLGKESREDWPVHTVIGSLCKGSSYGIGNDVFLA